LCERPLHGREPGQAHQFESIDLVYCHETSIDEAATILRVPRNTVKTHMFHMRKQLAQLLAAKGVQTAGAR